MTAPDPARPDKLRDLTRWNRAGLSRFTYVDGDAAIWLEELRLALLGLYLRGEPIADRLPETWRDVFLQPVDDWPDATRQTALAAIVSWARLMPARPPNRETRGQRGQRLLDQYNAPPAGDHAWEIARAFARAAHVHLGHLEAFAGEGYLRTATQWENLRRLAAMVNYQPGPPASASTTVALELAATAGVTEIAKGMAAKYTAPAGGAPLIFETLELLAAHPGLNAVRPAGWNVNHQPLALGGVTTPLPVTWLTGPKTRLAAGDLAIVAQGDRAVARQIVTAVPGDGSALVTLNEGTHSSVSFRTTNTRLWIAPGDVRLGEPVTAAGRPVIDLEAPLALTRGDIVRLDDPTAHFEPIFATVLSARGNALILRPESPLTGEWEVIPLLPVIADDQGWVLVAPTVGEVWFSGPGGIVSTPWSTTGSDTRIQPNPGGEASLNRQMKAGSFKADRGYILDGAATAGRGRVRDTMPEVVPGEGPLPDRTVAFTGKPPKSLTTGSWFVARAIASGGLSSLRVEGVSVTADAYHLLFDSDLHSAPDRTEFHGPLTEALFPLDHDRNPDPLGAAGTATLTALPPEARLLVKPGRRMIISRASPDGTTGEALATVTSVTDTTHGTSLTFASATDTGTWPKGDTTFRLNTLTLGHGEGKGPRLLGSGDAELPLQTFRLPVRDISHTASTASVSGVLPDVDVAVDGVVWPWRDHTDLTADGAKAWSSTLTETGEITIGFRRRLPTGTNNVTVLRHRVGTGLKGTGLPPFVFTKPMKKHPQIVAIYQPFPTSGGADRESVASLRTSTPARLAANGRAVSARDFERLATGLSAVWRARAEEIPGGGALRTLHLTVVPANGAALTTALEDELRLAILSDAIPGVRLTFAEFVPLSLVMAAEVRADLTSFDTADVKAACEAALAAAFALQARDFAQPAYVSEIMAVLETVPEVETAVVTAFGLATGSPAPANTIERDGAVAAIFPKPDQVAYAPAPGQPGAQATITVTVRAL